MKSKCGSLASAADDTLTTRLYQFSVPLLPKPQIVTMERKEQGLFGEYVPEIGQRHWRQPEDEKGELYAFERQIHSPSTQSAS